MKGKGLNLRQKKFVLEYLVDSNAYQAAVKAGYSETYARHRSYQLLENVDIRARIDSELKKIEDSKIAKADEVLKTLTRIMRGEETEEVVVTVGIGEGHSEEKIVDRKVCLKDRIEAADLLGKRHGLWVNKVQVSEVPIIVDDVHGGDDEDEEDDGTPKAAGNG